MHLATEVSSTTNHQPPSMDTKTTSNNSTGNGQNKNDTNNKNGNNNGFPTIQELADRTIDALLAEHPGELVRTGCPHIVINRR